MAIPSHFSFLSRMIPEREIKNPEVRELAKEAKAFLASQDWCQKVTAVSLAFAVAGVLGCTP